MRLAHGHPSRRSGGCAKTDDSDLRVRPGGCPAAAGAAPNGDPTYALKNVWVIQVHVCVRAVMGGEGGDGGIASLPVPSSQPVRPGISR